MAVRGVRGATTVAANTSDAIFSATLELVQLLAQRNEMRPEDIGYIWFTVTPDLDASFPADAARAGLGWSDVPLICGREIPVPGAVERCIRVLIAWNTTRSQKEIHHAFLRGARGLRPVWAIDLPGDAPLSR